MLLLKNTNKPTILLLGLLIISSLVLFVYYKYFKTEEPAEALIELTKEERKWLLENPNIKLVTVRNQEPIVMENTQGNPDGILKDIFDELSRLIGQEIELVIPEEVDKSFHLAAKKEGVYGAGTMIDIPQTRKMYHITEPILEVPTYIITNRNKLTEFKNVKDLEGRRIAVPTGHLAVIKYIEEAGATPVQVDTPLEQMQQVLKGETDALIGYSTYTYLLNKYLITELDIAFIADHEFKTYIGINPEHPQLHSILDKAIGQLGQQTISDILTKWADISRINKAPKINLTPEEKNYLKKKTSLTYCFNSGWKPYDFLEDGQHKGFFADYIALFSKRIGVPIEPVFSTSWPESYEKAIYGECNFYSGLVKTNEREKYFSFTKPYYRMSSVLLATADKPFVSSIQAINQPIGMDKNTAISTQISQKYPNTKLTFFNDRHQSLDALDKDKIYAIALQIHEAAEIIRNRGEQYKIIAMLDESYPISVAIVNNDSVLLGIFEKAIASITQADHNDIERKWSRVTVDVKEKIDYTLLWWILGGGAILFSAILLWSLSLQRARKEAVAARKKADTIKRELETIIENLPIVFFTKDTQGRHMIVNRRFEKNVGVSREDTIGKNDYEIFAEDVADKIRDIDNKVLIEGEKLNFEERVPHPDGKVHEYLTTKVPLINEDGKIYGLIGIATDITEIKRIEQELREAKEFQEIAFNSIPDAIGITRLTDYLIVYMNEALTTLTGFSKEDLLGKRSIDVDFWDDLNDRTKLIEEIKKRGAVSNLEIVFKRKDGSKFIALYSARIFKSENIPHFISVIRNISERKQMEQDLFKAKEAAEAANKAKSEFLSNMSHEIRTPMNAVLGYTEILKGIENDTTKSEYLNSIKTAGKALLTLINDILDLSRIESGKLELYYSAISVRNLVREMEILFAEKALSKHIQFIVEGLDLLPEALLLDEVRMRQVLINLISNAIKFTDKGYVKVVVQTSNGLEEKSCINLTIRVEDTGIGIPPGEQENIFASFEQAIGKNAQYSGSGLGLTITKRIVEKMQGSISVESIPGKGSTFTIFLPDVETAAAESVETQRNMNIKFGAIRFKPAKILIADDIDYNRDIIATFLKPFGFDLLLAKNGIEVLELVNTAMPDLILLDMKMPEMDGFEAIEKLRNEIVSADIPIIAITAFALSHDEEIISKLCSGYLRKPISKSDLVNEIMKFLPHKIDKAEANMLKANVNSDFSADELHNELIELPDNQRMQLIELAEIGSADELDNILNEIKRNFPAVSTKIENYLKDYKFELIIEFLKNEK